MDALSRPTSDQAIEAIRTLISFIGDDPYREGMIETPLRVLKAWGKDWGRGYEPIEPQELIKLFEVGESKRNYSGRKRFDQMVIVKDITLFSHCEHHMTPFFGRAHIAYIPGERGLIGLSKMARVIDHFSRRLQVQERLTVQIADFLAQHLAGDIGVTLSCTHLCMVSRGVQQPHSTTQTTALRGAFYDDPTTRAEFIRACPSA